MEIGKSVIDTASGCFPAVQWFRSIVVFLGEPNSRHLSSLTRWVREYDFWYRCSTGVAFGYRLRLMYHREISVIGHFLPDIEPLYQLSTLARRLGMGLSYSFRAEDTLEHQEVLRRLAEMPGLTSVGVVVSRATPNTIAPFLEQSAVYFLRCGVQLGVVAPIDKLKELKLLENPFVSSANVTIYPPNESSKTGRYVVPSTPVPCSNLFRIHITAVGEVYPCLGLVNVAEACLGSVYEPFSESVFCSRPTQLDFVSLALEGPRLRPESLKPRKASGLPASCEHHRAQLLESGS